MTQKPFDLPTPAPGDGASASASLQGYAAFAAQLMGQDGQRRGLRAGPQAVQSAQGAYREREFSGPGDRRLSAGALARTAV